MAVVPRRPGPQFLRPDGLPPRVVVVDDEVDLTTALVSAFSYDGWHAQGATDGRSGLSLAAEAPADLVVLDVGLPDLDGFEVLHRLRAASEHVCVLFLTARDAVADRVAGITAGADDYVSKPFSIEEVLARSRGLLRRSGVASARTGSQLRVGDLVLDEGAREVYRANAPIDLTATEFELLRFLMRNPRQVMSKDQILDHVWKYDFGGNSHVVELYISYLRKKLDAGRPPMIHTVRGFGYVLKPVAQ
jgi:two-component system OmpR family response regulator